MRTSYHLYILLVLTSPGMSNNHQVHTTDCLWPIILKTTMELLCRAQVQPLVCSGTHAKGQTLGRYDCTFRVACVADNTLIHEYTRRTVRMKNAPVHAMTHRAIFYVLFQGLDVRAILRCRQALVIKSPSTDGLWLSKYGRMIGRYFDCTVTHFEQPSCEREADGVS